MKILVIAPHPDDEVYGCGGTIAKLASEGSEVFLCVVTKGCPPYRADLEERRREVFRVNEILGIKDTRFLDLPATKLDTIPQGELNNYISECIEDFKPQVVLTTPESDAHKDHQLTFGATLVAARPISGVRWLLCYETVSARIFIPNVFIDISETLKTKLKAMREYKLEKKDFPHPLSLRAMEALSRVRGTNSNAKAAEGFILIRGTW